jgi:hypothetical protein
MTNKRNRQQQQQTQIPFGNDKQKGREQTKEGNKQRKRTKGGNEKEGGMCVAGSVRNV